MHDIMHSLNMWTSHVIALAVSMCAFAGDVTFDLTPLQGWAGTPAVLKITVRNGTTIADPLLPTVEGLDFVLQPGRQTMNSMQVINGRVTRDNTTVLNVLVTPKAAGQFNIPPITIDVDGVQHSSGRLTFSSLKSEAGDLLKAQIITDQPILWEGQTVNATLRIEVKPYQSREHRVTLREGDMWQFIDLEKCEFGPFKQRMRELLQANQRPQGREALVDGQSMLVYEVTAPLTMGASGVPDCSSIRIVWNYPSRLTANQDFFGRSELSVSATRPITADATASGIEVKPLPQDGRPADFTGAVGSFSIEASAKPLSLGVGDPVTLTYRITDTSGIGRLDSVGPPRLDSPSITQDFRIPTAPLAGSVQGNTKTFTQTLRPTAESVREIPPIAFSWFDPNTGRYETAASKPIALSVSAVERLSTDAILGNTKVPVQSAPTLIATAGGLGANAPVTPAIVRSHPVGRVSWPLIGAAFFLPPLACAAVLVARRRQDRLLTDRGLVQERGARQRATARARAGAGAEAVQNYIADRLHRPSGTVTRAEAVRCLRVAGADDVLQRQVEGILARAEKARYSASGTAGVPVTDDAAQAVSCIALLDRLNWRAARAGTEATE